MVCFVLKFQNSGCDNNKGSKLRNFGPVYTEFANHAGPKLNTLQHVFISRHIWEEITQTLEVSDSDFSACSIRKSSNLP